VAGRRPGAALAGDLRREFLRDAGWFALASGLAMGLAGLALWLWSAWYAGDPPKLQRSVLLTMLVVAGLGNVLRLAAGDQRLILWAALALPVFCGIMYLPGLAYFFELVPLSPPRWLLCTAAAMVAVLLGELASRR
jgi:hypothetical protein